MVEQINKNPEMFGLDKNGDFKNPKDFEKYGMINQLINEKNKIANRWNQIIKSNNYLSSEFNEIETRRGINGWYEINSILPSMIIKKKKK